MNVSLRITLTTLATAGVLALAVPPADAQSRRVVRFTEPANAAAQNPPVPRRSRLSESAREDQIARLCRDAQGGRVYNETRRDRNGRFVYCPGRKGK